MDEKTQVKRYKIQHSIDEYTFPKEAYIHDVRFDEKHMHVELTDQRVISIPYGGHLQLIMHLMKTARSLRSIKAEQ